MPSQKAEFDYVPSIKPRFAVLVGGNMKENEFKKIRKRKRKDERDCRLGNVIDKKPEQPFLESTEGGRLGMGRDDSFTEEGSYPVNNPLPY